MNIEKLLSEMTLSEKCAMLVGQDSWHTYAIPRLNIPSIMMADGPHGLRKQLESGNSVTIHESYKAVCFPAEVTIAASFDPELAYEMGSAIANECLNKDVQALLGPGLNIKRSPLCGRNFEYYSEDPLLSGEMGASFVRGIQSKNVGACIKHFALNSQETYRMSSNSVCDERAFYEIYTKAFKRAIEENPAMVMCSYNKVRGIYASENNHLLQEVLRNEFGFKNVIVSDWTAVNKRTDALKATLDLEMPGYIYSVHQLEKSAKAGAITMEEIDASVRRILQLVESKVSNRIKDFDLAENHQIAKKIAGESAVLLKNEAGFLPLREGEKVAVIGQLAKNVRYQGGGSSHINPFRIDSLIDAMPAGTYYAEGYSLDGDGFDEIRLQEAKYVAEGKDKIILVLGLTDEYESEGYDRKHLSLPRGHEELVKAVLSVNPNVAVVLQIGSPVLMPWLDSVKAVLNAYLVGEAGAGAIAEILTGKINPSGRLAETFPAALEDTPCLNDYARGNSDVNYKESIYVGYRYYATKGKKTLFPFGYGLSYTSFEYSDLQVSSPELQVPGTVKVSLTLRNTGSVSGKEVVQLYVENGECVQFRPIRELRKFQKIQLEPGEAKTLEFTLTEADFSYYEPAVHAFTTPSGNYRIQIRRDVDTGVLEQEIKVTNPVSVPVASAFENARSYFVKGKLSFTDPDFEALIGQPLGPTHVIHQRPYDINNTLEDLSATRLGRFVAKKFVSVATGSLKDSDAVYRRMVEKSLLETPLRSEVVFSGGMISMHLMMAIIELCNLHVFKAIGYLFRRD